MNFKSLKEAVEYWNWKQEQDLLEGTQVGSKERHVLSAEECIRLRDYGYRPYERIPIYGFEAEMISFPFPHKKFGAAINVREPGDPTTMVEAAINPGVFKVLAA